MKEAERRTWRGGGKGGTKAYRPKGGHSRPKRGRVEAARRHSSPRCHLPCRPPPPPPQPPRPVRIADDCLYVNVPIYTVTWSPPGRLAESPAGGRQRGPDGSRTRAGRSAGGRLGRRRDSDGGDSDGGSTPGVVRACAGHLCGSRAGRVDSGGGGGGGGGQQLERVRDSACGIGGGVCVRERETEGGRELPLPPFLASLAPGPHPPRVPRRV